MLCTLSFLVLAENIHIHYGRLLPTELKVYILPDNCDLMSNVAAVTSSIQERAENIGYATFAILFAVLDIGFVIVRVAGLVALSGSPALATTLVLVSMSPSVILPMLTYLARLLRQRISGEVQMESGTVVDEARD